MRSHKVQAFVVGVLLLALAGLAYVTSDPRGAISGPESILREVVAPFQRGFAALSRAVVGAVETLASIGRLQQDNRILRQEIAALRLELQELEEYRRENAKLREIVGLRERLPRPTVVAQVIARPYNQWFSSVTIDRGARDGLRVGMPVINSQGVVGYIESVTASTARVLLVTDPTSAIGGVVVDSEIPVLVEGTGDPAGREAVVRPLVWRTELKAGDVVVTSGLSQTFPKGLPIGVIDAVFDDESGLKQQAVLKLNVDFNRLDWVTVILETEGDEILWPKPASEIQ